MDRAPFSAFLLLLVGIVLLAQVVTGNIDTFVAALFGQAEPATGTGTSSSAGGGTGGAIPTSYAGNRRATGSAT